MNHVIMANHMISLITSSTTDPGCFIFTVSIEFDIGVLQNLFMVSMSFQNGLCHFKNGQVKCTYVQSLHLDLYKMDVSFYIYMVQLKKKKMSSFKRFM